MMHRREVLTLLAGVLGGCGYGLAGGGHGLPPGTRTMAIKLFANHTREKGIEVSLQRALEDEFRRRGPLTIVRDPAGDVVLSGAIRRFSTTPLAFGAADEAVQYVGSLSVSCTLRERESRRVIFRNRKLEESLDFGATSNVVVTTSPKFQQGTLDARDLIDFTNVQLGESRRRDALNQLVDRVARNVYLQTMEGF